MRSVLDTSIVIASDVASLDGDLAISSVTLAELHFGVLVAKQQQRVPSACAVCCCSSEPLTPFPSTKRSRPVTASSRQPSQAGRQPRARSLDLLIAATAHAHSARLYTRNAEDYLGIEGLVDVVVA